MSNPKISVVVPVYNVAPYLARCLDSLVAQTLSDIEIICIDDKSTDNSLEILQEYKNKYPQIHVIALDKNSGVATARNAGIDAARGKYLGFVDSDDYIDADFYEKLYATAKKENADMVRGNVKIVQYDGSIFTDHNEIKDVQKHGKWHFCWQWWTAIYRAKMIKDAGLKFPTDVISGQDTVFLTACLNSTNTVAVRTDVFYNYIRREGSLDEQIMPPHKIASRIKALSMVADIYNSSVTISDADYIARYAVVLGGMENHFRRNTSKQCRESIGAATIEIFKCCKHKSAVAKNLARRWGKHFADCLLSYDADGIVECWAGIQSQATQKKNDIRKTAYLFGFVPVARIYRSDKKLLIRIFGLKVLQVKNEYGVYRLNFMYLPIIRIKSK